MSGLEPIVDFELACSSKQVMTLARYRRGVSDHLRHRPSGSSSDVQVNDLTNVCQVLEDDGCPSSPVTGDEQNILDVARSILYAAEWWKIKVDTICNSACRGKLAAAFTGTVRWGRMASCCSCVEVTSSGQHPPPTQGIQYMKAFLTACGSSSICYSAVISTSRSPTVMITYWLDVPNINLSGCNNTVGLTRACAIRLPVRYTDDDRTTRYVHLAPDMTTACLHIMRWSTTKLPCHLFSVYVHPSPRAMGVTVLARRGWASILLWESSNSLMFEVNVGFVLHLYLLSMDVRFWAHGQAGNPVGHRRDIQIYQRRGSHYCQL